MTMPTLEDLAVSLTPSMRKVLRENDGAVDPKTTYWITLQGMIARGLLDAPANRRAPHPLTQLGHAYRRALLAGLNTSEG